MEERISQLFPLLLFTSLMIISVAAVVAVAGQEFFGQDQTLWPPLGLFAGSATALIGILISLLHLGRKARLLLAATGLAHSWLSREVVICTLFTFSAFLAAISASMAPVAILTAILTAFATLIGLGTVISIGMVYQLTGQINWQGARQVISPLVSSLYLALGITFTLNTAEWINRAFWLTLTIDALLWSRRCLMYIRTAAGGPHVLAFPHLVSIVSAAHLFRAMLGTALPALLSFSLPLGVPVAIALSIFVDRFLLYAGTAQRTPRAEVARIKAERMKEAILSR